MDAWSFGWVTTYQCGYTVLGFAEKHSQAFYKMPKDRLKLYSGEQKILVMCKRLACCAIFCF